MLRERFQPGYLASEVIITFTDGLIFLNSVLDMLRLIKILQILEKLQNDFFLLKRGWLYLPSTELFTLANITAQEANSKAMHAVQISVPTYTQHQQLQRTHHSHPLHLFHCEQHVMHTSSVFGRERLQIGTVYLWT